jgi:hypothetical protein
VLGVSQLFVALLLELGKAIFEEFLFVEAVRDLQKDENIVVLSSIGHVLPEYLEERLHLQILDDGIVLEYLRTTDFDGKTVEALEDIGEVVFLEYWGEYIEVLLDF